MEWEKNDKNEFIELSHSRYPIPKYPRENFLENLKKSDGFAGFYIDEDDANWVHFAFKDTHHKVYDVRTSLKL